MLPAPLLDAVVDDGEVGRAEDAQRGGEAAFAVPVAGEGPQDEVGDVDQDAEERGGQPRIPRPEVAPDLGAPQGAGGEHDGPEHRGDLGARAGQRVGEVGALEEIEDRPDAARRAAEIHRVRGRDVEVEDLVDDPHALLFGSDERRVRDRDQDERAGHAQDGVEGDVGLGDGALSGEHLRKHGTAPRAILQGSYFRVSISSSMKRR